MQYGLPKAGGSALTLADFFQPERWTEGAVQIPNELEPVQGAISTDFSRHCTDTRRLELRFSRPDGRLTFELAQALLSHQSDVTVEYRLVADGRLVETQRVAFSERRTLELDLVGVSAVVLEVVPHQGEGRGGCATTAVVTRVTVEPRNR